MKFDGKIKTKGRPLQKKEGKRRPRPPFEKRRAGAVAPALKMNCEFFARTAISRIAYPRTAFRPFQNRYRCGRFRRNRER